MDDNKFKSVGHWGMFPDEDRPHRVHIRVDGRPRHEPETLAAIAKANKAFQKGSPFRPMSPGAILDQNA